RWPGQVTWCSSCTGCGNFAAHDRAARVELGKDGLSFQPGTVLLSFPVPLDVSVPAPWRLSAGRRYNLDCELAPFCWPATGRPQLPREGSVLISTLLE